MSLANSIYNTLFKRTSTFALTCVFSAFFFERTFDLAADKLFEKYNEGKLWKDIKDKYQ
ncbi:cytochrome b-c1 complex subunit 9 [Cylas formicarius]|uniref:cytochrome b-c1 complex subunit 9 n=1 Tax=Cylas formicarius TaxID=197179 RepID=UPI002958DC9A|nr:cytochrome b-c1 complex subunit 9 [Cylas formicarius]